MRTIGITVLATLVLLRSGGCATPPRVAIRPSASQPAQTAARAGAADGHVGAAQQRMPPAAPETSQPASISTELRFELPTGGRVLAPAALPATGRTPDLLIHFHGAPDVVEREFMATGAQAALVVVNYSGLSAAYEKPTSDPTRFPQILHDTLAGLIQRGRLPADAQWRRICLSSFSAGYGAVRALLRQPESFARVDAIYLADSLYAGYDEAGGGRRVSADNMAPFRAWASAAARGRKFLLLTHSYLEPGRYAGTHETADDLVAWVGATRAAADEWVTVGESRVHVVSSVDRGDFHVRGWEGATGAAHMQHLRNLRWGLARLPLERGGGP